MYLLFSKVSNFLFNEDVIYLGSPVIANLPLLGHYLFKLEFTAGYTLLNCTLPDQNLLYRNQVNRTLLDQETAKPYLAKPDSAKQEYGKSSFRHLLNHTLLNRNLMKQETGIC